MIVGRNAEGVNIVFLVDCDVDCAMSETTYFNVQKDAEDLEGPYGYWEARHTCGEVTAARCLNRVPLTYL